MEWVDRAIRDFNATLGSFRLAIRNNEDRLTTVTLGFEQERAKLDQRIKVLEANVSGLARRADNTSESLAARAVCETKLSRRIDALVQGYAEVERRQRLIDHYWQNSGPWSARDKAEDFYRNGAVTDRMEHEKSHIEETTNGGLVERGKPFEDCDMIELIAAFNDYNARIFHTLSNFSDPEKTHSRQLAALCDLRDEAYTWILTRKRDGKE